MDIDRRHEPSVLDKRRREMGAHAANGEMGGGFLALQTDISERIIDANGSAGTVFRDERGAEMFYAMAGRGARHRSVRPVALNDGELARLVDLGVAATANAQMATKQLGCGGHHRVRIGEVVKRVIEDNSERLAPLSKHAPGRLDALVDQSRNLSAVIAQWAEAVVEVGRLRARAAAG